jgi:hypothetical protein
MTALSALERLQLELAEARQALVEAERQRQQERQRADEAEQQQQQAEQERQQERRRAEEAEQERQYERQRNQPTTLDEFLEACHLHISKPLAVQTDRLLSTGGGITKPNNRHYPQKLRQWTHFPDTQTRLFHRLHGVFHPASEPPLRLFDPVIHLEVLGPKLCDRPLASETDLQQYERPAVEQPVTSVISALRDRSADSIFNVGNGIIFESHPNTLRKNYIIVHTSSSDDSREICPPLRQVSRRPKVSLEVTPGVSPGQILPVITEYFSLTRLTGRSAPTPTHKLLHP